MASWPILGLANFSIASRYRSSESDLLVTIMDIDSIASVEINYQRPPVIKFFAFHPGNESDKTPLCEWIKHKHALESLPLVLHD